MTAVKISALPAAGTLTDATILPVVKSSVTSQTTVADLRTALNLPSQTFPGGLIVGNAGTEGDGVNIGGVTYESTFKVSDIDGTNYAQTILHRHSTTLEPLIVGARSNSNTTSHTSVTAGQNVFSVYGTGWAGSNYKIFGSVSVAADLTGSISNTSSPGAIKFSVSPDGTVTPVVALTIKNDGSATFSNAAGWRTGLGITVIPPLIIHQQFGGI